MPTPRQCPQCGAIPATDSVKGLCPKCLMGAGLGGGRLPLEELADFNPEIDHVDRYTILEKIGEGGCGVVYRAKQEEAVVRTVALKIIKLGMDTRSVMARFEGERQALAVMDHPNTTFEFSSDGRLFLSGSEDRIVWLLDATTGKPLSEPVRNRDPILNAHFAPDGSKFVVVCRGESGGKTESSVRLFDSETGSPLTEELPDCSRASHAFFSPDGQILYVNTSDGTVRCWALPTPPLPVPAWLPDIAECLAGERLSEIRVPEPVDPAALTHLRESVDMGTKGAWNDWKTWFLADRRSRPGQPWARIYAAEESNPGPTLRTSDAQAEFLLHRAGSLRNQRRFLEAAVDFCLAKNIPPRAPGVGHEQVDLTLYYNASFTEKRDLRISESHLKELGTGTRVFGGVLFDVRGLVQVGSLPPAKINSP